LKADRYLIGTCVVVLALVGGLPGNGLDIVAVDADIGKLAVAQAGKLVQAAVVLLPLVKEADKGGNHGGSLSVVTGAVQVNRVTVKIARFGEFKRIYAALQLGEKRIA
jgi:hypothetical protein